MRARQELPVGTGVALLWTWLMVTTGQAPERCPAVLTGSTLELCYPVAKLDFSMHEIEEMLWAVTCTTTGETHYYPVDINGLLDTITPFNITGLELATECGHLHHFLPKIKLSHHTTQFYVILKTHATNDIGELRNLAMHLETRLSFKSDPSVICTWSLNVLQELNHGTCRTLSLPDDGVKIECLSDTARSLVSYKCNVSFAFQKGKITYFNLSQVTYVRETLCGDHWIIRCFVIHYPTEPGTYSYNAQVTESFSNKHPVHRFFELAERITIPIPTVRIFIEPSSSQCETYPANNVSLICTTEGFPSGPLIQWYLEDPPLKLYMGDGKIIQISLDISSPQRRLICEASSGRSESRWRDTVSLSRIQSVVSPVSSDSLVFEGENGERLGDVLHMKESEQLTIFCRLLVKDVRVTRSVGLCRNRQQDGGSWILDMGDNNNDNDDINSVVSFIVFGTSLFNNSQCDCSVAWEGSCFNVTANITIHVIPNPGLSQKNAEEEERFQQVLKDSVTLQPTFILCIAIPALGILCLIMFAVLVCYRERKSFPCCRKSWRSIRVNMYEYITAYAGGENPQPPLSFPPPLPTSTSVFEPQHGYITSRSMSFSNTTFDWNSYDGSSLDIQYLTPFVSSSNGSDGHVEPVSCEEGEYCIEFESQCGSQDESSR